MQIFRDIIKDLITICTLINTILYLYSWVKNKGSAKTRYLALFILSLFVTHSITMYTAYKGLNNLYVAHYYFWLQFLFLSLFYRKIFKPNQKKWVFRLIVLVVTSLIIYYALKPEKYFELSLYEIFITNVPLIFFSIIHLYNMLSDKESYFYINGAILVYISSSTIVFFLGTFLMADATEHGISIETARNIWTIQNILYLFFLILFIVEWKKTIFKWKHLKK
ncbi:hypothetical protein SCB49_08318 [unidentified eubacterium SCB49]|nr:hypothetical protein SCB49_08318 [unidentified eubacterium SCB49]